MTVLAAAKLASSLLGGKQIGPAAPAFQPGPMSLIGQTEPSGFLQQLLAHDPTGGVGGVLGDIPQMNKPTKPADFVQEQAPESLGGFDKKPIQKFQTGEDLGELRPGGGLLGGFNNFFGNLDEGLQSPSRIIAMGLLNRVDPRLGMAGLALQGLLGPNKVF